MKVKKKTSLYLFAVLSYCFSGVSVFAEEYNAKEMIALISEYKKPMVPVLCSAKYFEDVMKELDGYDKEKASTIIQIMINSIYCSFRPVTDKREKVLYILKYINSKKIDITPQIITAILPMIDSSEDEAVFREAVVLLLDNASIYLKNIKPDEFSFILNYKFQEKNK